MEISHQSAVPIEVTRQEFSISTDKEKLQLDVIHGFLGNSYWAEGIDISVVQQSIASSLCFGVYRGDKQVGFARLVTDLATFGYLADVFVVDDFQGRGLGSWLVQTILSHPIIPFLRRVMLFTRDAHALYAKFGFTPLPGSENGMEIVNIAAVHGEHAEVLPVEPYRRRRTWPMQSVNWSGWNLKRYIIESDANNVNADDILATAESYTRAMLPAASSDDTIPKAGFTTLHIGQEAVWLLIDLWHRDILKHSLYYAPLDRPHLFRPGPCDGTCACVWELSVICHEKDAWVRHVLAEPLKPDLQGYLQDRLEITAQKGR